MTNEQIAFTAKRLTDNTALYSMSLGLPEGSPMRKAAQEFFKERELFGIDGWCTVAEAADQIRKHLRDNSFQEPRP